MKILGNFAAAAVTTIVIVFVLGYLYQQHCVN